MKRFIITNLFALMALPILACAWNETHNYYLFSVYDRNDFQQRVNDITLNNWKTYLGKSDNYYYFNADEIIEAAKGKNDLLMISYVENLNKYLGCVKTEQQKEYEWNYPSKEEIAACEADLQTVRSYAFSKLKTRLRSQHGLLYMRCNMMMGKHQENITFWEQTASQYIETVYKDMMKNIYAGALYKTGKEDKAGELFAEMGDYASLMTLYYKKRSYFAIQREYRMNPNAKVLPFLLQDFVNNAQEADDATRPDAFTGGKLFIRDLTKTEVQQMINFCEQVIREGKTETPALWKSAKAWLEYMFGNKQQALKDITEAGTLAGTPRMEENTRILKLFIASALEPQSADFDFWLSNELQWLFDKKKSDNESNAYLAYDRISHQVLSQRFHAEGHPQRALALMKSGGFYAYTLTVDTISPEAMISFLKYMDSPSKTPLDRFLKSSVKVTREGPLQDQPDEKAEIDNADLIGKKYLRRCQWKEAAEWLKKVPATYCDEQGWGHYAAYRSPTVEPWIRRQWVKDEVAWSSDRNHLYINPRLRFAQDMAEMEGELHVLEGEALMKRYYDLAVRYAQAHYTGDCWWIMRDFKSITDTVRVNETNLAARAIEYLQKASETKDAALKEKIYFARCYSGLYEESSSWYEKVWNDQTYEYDRKVKTDAPQYRSFATLADYEKNNKASQYVSRCDEYKQFCKQYH